MNRQEANPFYGPLATSARDRLTFGAEHVYGHSTYGTDAENRSFTSGDIRKWYDRYFYAENIILFISGNFNKDNLKPVIERKLWFKKKSANHYGKIFTWQTHHRNVS
jgi:predicted Zn-dependent peptidase